LLALDRAICSGGAGVGYEYVDTVLGGDFVLKSVVGCSGS